MSENRIEVAAQRVGSDDSTANWQQDDAHRAWLRADAHRQLSFFAKSLRGDGGFDVLDSDGTPRPGPQELHTTTRLVHSYAMAHVAGASDCGPIVEAGLSFLQKRHHDAEFGGYYWAVEHDGTVTDDKKLAYGHVFVLLAASSALSAGFDTARPLFEDIKSVIDARYWDAKVGLLRDEYNRDWTPFSNYRGYNSNMHGCEAFLAAYEATGDAGFLDKASSILEFFTEKVAPQYDWRVPEHFSTDWTVDLTYEGNPMFRPKGTTPGHSFELARLLLQHWDLSGRTDEGAVSRARNLVETALSDAWMPEGGVAYTLDYEAAVQVADRYWWPVTEAIGVLSALIKIEGREADEQWYRRLWKSADHLFIDHERGGWYPEIDANGAPVAIQFLGKPDIYHALQADLLPLTDGISGAFPSLQRLRPLV